MTNTTQSTSAAQTTTSEAGGQTADASAAQGVAELPASLSSLVLSQQGTRTQSEITGSFPNPSEADALFNQLGWAASSYEVFVAPEGTSTTDSVYEVDIGIHQLGGAEQARQAMQYFMAARADLLGLWTAEVEPLGAVSLGLIGPSGDGGYEASVYTATGSQVVRVTALSWTSIRCRLQPASCVRWSGDSIEGALPRRLAARDR